MQTSLFHTLSSTRPISKEDIARLSPYLTGHIKRFGDYVLDLDTVPQDIEIIKNLSLF